MYILIEFFYHQPSGNLYSALEAGNLFYQILRVLFPDSNQVLFKLLYFSNNSSKSSLLATMTKKVKYILEEIKCVFEYFIQGIIKQFTGMFLAPYPWYL